MSKVIVNPYLPLYEYIPDGEPHVFSDENGNERIYIYGSHDRFAGKKFCMNHYVSYSAPMEDLTDWRYEGVIYRNDQDPRMKDGTHELWAPDVVRGKDGRYYLYYCPDDSIRSIGVAVSDRPAGKYEFYGIIQDEFGRAIGEREGDTIAFDPGVFIDDDGRIYLYSGNGPRTRAQIGKEPKASMVMELNDDMRTLKSGPKKLLPVLGEADGTGFQGHEFFEASSIRKVNGTYYLIYSSVNLHELCYATSDRPDGGFSYGGVIVSNAEIFADDPSQKTPLNAYGNDHGGIERIGNDYYIFYHRQTNRSNFSRQGCAERIRILPDGRIPQAHLTSQGLSGKALPGQGTYPAPVAAVIHGAKPQAISHILAMGKKHPYITQDAPDADAGDVLSGKVSAPKSYIANVKNGFVAAYRYFDLTETKKITVCYRGKGRGTLGIYAAQKAAGATFGKLSISDIAGTPGVRKVGELSLQKVPDWTEVTAELAVAAKAGGITEAFEATGKDIAATLPETELILSFQGRGSFDLLSFTLA